MVLDRHSHVTLDTCQLHDTWSSGVWARGASSGHVLDSSVARCGGYGALYCTNGAVIKMDKVIAVWTEFHSNLSIFLAYARVSPFSKEDFQKILFSNHEELSATLLLFPSCQGFQH